MMQSPNKSSHFEARFEVHTCNKIEGFIFRARKNKSNCAESVDFGTKPNALFFVLLVVYILTDLNTTHSLLLRIGEKLGMAKGTAQSNVTVCR